MGQGDIMELLKKEKRYLSTNEIAEKLRVGKSTTIMSLRKMTYSHTLKGRVSSRGETKPKGI